MVRSTGCARFHIAGLLYLLSLLDTLCTDCLLEFHILPTFTDVHVI